jgi:hypothetical protein
MPQFRCQPFVGDWRKEKMGHRSDGACVVAIAKLPDGPHRFV